MHGKLSDLALDALGEISNIGSGHAATALSMLIGRPVDLTVPNASLVPLAEATEQLGDPETEVIAVLTPVGGGMTAQVLLVFDMQSAAALCTMLGVERDTEMGLSALREIGNILTSSYVTAIAQLTGMPLEPAPPLSAVSWLGALVDETLATAATQSDEVLMLRTAIRIEGEDSRFSFLFVTTGGIAKLLGGLGIAA